MIRGHTAKGPAIDLDEHFDEEMRRLRHRHDTVAKRHSRAEGGDAELRFEGADFHRERATMAENPLGFWQKTTIPLSHENVQSHPRRRNLYARSLRNGDGADDHPRHG